MVQRRTRGLGAVPTSHSGVMPTLECIDIVVARDLSLVSFSRLLVWIGLVAWHSGRTSVFGRRTFPVLRSTCS